MKRRMVASLAVLALAFASAPETRANDHLLTLVLGDWSSDGHHATERLYIRSNLSSVEIQEALKIAYKKIGFNFAETVGQEAFDSHIRKRDIAALRSAGIQVELCLEDCYEDDDLVEFDGAAEEYAPIWLQLVKLGNPSFEYAFVEAESCELHLGGYGLLTP